MRVNSRERKPNTAHVVPWPQIEAFYEDLISCGLPFQSLLLLVQFIRNSGFDERLFGYTSMHKLVITIYYTPEWDREALHIEFNHHTKKIHFEYRPKPYAPAEPERFYLEDDIIPKFTKYIDWLKW